MDHIHEALASQLRGHKNLLPRKPVHNRYIGPNNGFAWSKSCEGFVSMALLFHIQLRLIYTFPELRISFKKEILGLLETQASSTQVLIVILRTEVRLTFKFILADTVYHPLGQNR
jgi:hypothetical protein